MLPVGVDEAGAAGVSGQQEPGRRVASNEAGTPPGLLLTTDSRGAGFVDVNWQHGGGDW